MAKDVGQTVAEAVAKCVDPVLEPKWNGWRCIVIRTADGVDVYKPSRNSDPSKRYNGKLPELESEFAKLPVGTILDGELVAMEYNVDECRWVEDFHHVHTCMRSNKTTSEQRAKIKFVAFDLIAEDEAPDVWSAILPLRRSALGELIRRYGLEMVEMTIQLPATQDSHDDLVKMGFEGSVVKDEDKPYAFGKRGHGWFKVKNVRTIDCIVMEVLMDGKGQNSGKAGRMLVGQWKPMPVSGKDLDWLRKKVQYMTDTDSLARSRFIDGKAYVLVPICTVNLLNDAHRNEATANPVSQIGRVIEVKIYGWDGEGPRHPTPLRFRDGDKLPQECLWSRV